MTSDQRTSLAIIIRLWVVFLLLVSSRFAPRVAILILHLIGLSCFLTSLSWVFTRSSLTQRHSDCWSPSNLSSLTPHSKLSLRLHIHSFLVFSSTFSPSLCLSQVFCLFHFCILPPHFDSSQPHPSASFTFFFFFLFFLRRVLEGFTKTAICQGHRLHFAICCKIKLGEGCVSPIVWAASALHDISSHIRPGTPSERWKEMNWMTDKDEMSFCAPHVCLREIIWHRHVPFLIVYSFFFVTTSSLLGNMQRSVALFLPHFVPNMSPWMLRPVVTLSAKGLWGIEYNWVSTTNSGRGLAEFQGDSALWSWNASRTSCPSVRQTEREREQERPEAMSERRAALLLIQTDLFHTNMLTWAAWGSNTNALGRRALPAEIRKIRTVTSAFVVIRGTLICSVFFSSKATSFQVLCWIIRQREQS